MKILLKVSISVLVLAVIGAVILLPVGNSPATEAQRAPAGAQANFTTQNGIFVGEPVEPELTIALRDAPLAEIEYELDREINPRIDFTGSMDPSFRQESGLDPLLAVQAAAVPSAVDPGFLTPIHNFNGMASMGATPPDTVGDVGINEYIQMTNGSMTYLTIYNKTTGAVIAGPIGLETLGSGGVCATGMGDPIVLYDELADKWMLSEFAASGNNLCIYISTTGDPTGTYWRYVFSTPSFPDYPKYAVWPDAYYMTANEGPSIYALDRANMIIGGTARPYQRFTAPGLSAFGFETLTPADLDGDTPPPAGSPGIIMRHIDTEAHSGYSGYPTNDLLDMWAFDVDWNTPANSTFTRLPYILTSEFTSELCGYTAFACFPQQGSGITLDPLREVIMFRLQYRNFGTYEALVGNLVTDVNGADRGGIRWFELRKEGAGAWSLFQEGTYAPATDTHSRWMGAIAMDGSGNIAVGYNVSSTSMYPSLRYAGRLRTDELGTMPQGEVYLANGSAPSSSNRYGDYAAMSVDPVDDCTFWFTGEYNTGGSWSTRIGAFKFDACTGGLGPDFALEATPASQTMCTPETATYDLALSPLFGFDIPITLTAYGVPAETTHAFGPNPATPPLTATLSITTTSLTAAGSYNIDIIGTTATRTHTATVTLNLYTPVLPNPALLSPAEGADNQPLIPTFDWADQGNTLSYNFELALSPLFDEPLVSVTGLTESQYAMDAELESGVCYWWSAQAANMCAVGDWADTYHFATILYYTAFEDDIENGSTLWSHSATVGADEWIISDLQSHSPSHAWYVPNAGVKTDSALRLSSTVPAGEGSLLIFWHRYEFEGANNDGGVLEISTNNGGTWLDLGTSITENGYNGTIKAASNNPLHGRPGFVGDLTTWTQVTVDLSAFAGEDVLVRWRFGADGGNSDVGWFIDDARILSPMPANPAPEVLTLTPASGAPGVPIAITVTGSGFLGSPALRLGSLWLEDVTVVDDTHLSALIPAGLSEGTYDLVLYNGDCQEITLLGAFTIATGDEITGLAAINDGPTMFGYATALEASITAGSNVVYTWDFGDGTYGSGMATTHVYAAPGTYIATVTATNSLGSVSAETIVVVTRLVYIPHLYRGG